MAFDMQSLDIPKYAVPDTATEIARFDEARAAVRKDLERLYEQTAKELGKRHADIFQAHLMLLDDVTVREEIIERLHTEKLTPNSTWLSP